MKKKYVDDGSDDDDDVHGQCVCLFACLLCALCYVKNSLQTRLMEQSDDGFICYFSFFPLDMNHSLMRTYTMCVRVCV